MIKAIQRHSQLRLPGGGFNAAPVMGMLEYLDADPRQVYEALQRKIQARVLQQIAQAATHPNRITLY